MRVLQFRFRRTKPRFLLERMVLAEDFRQSLERKDMVVNSQQSFSLPKALVEYSQRSSFLPQEVLSQTRPLR